VRNPCAAVSLPLEELTQVMRLAMLVGVVSAASALAQAAPLPADMVLRHAHIWTADAAHPWAEALAVREGRLVYVGAASGLDAFRGPRTRVLDGGGRLVVPGFNDAHIHLVEGALALDRVELIEDPTLAGVQARIRAFAAAHPQSPWVVGRGWLYGAFPGGLPTKEQLDAVVSDRPAYMDCYDGHSGWANSRALQAAGITKDTPDPAHGAIVRDPKTGEPTGALKESATALVTRLIPETAPAERQALFARAMAQLNAQGITSVQDAGYSPKDLETALPVFERALADGTLTVRTRVSVQMAPATVDDAIAAAARLAARHHDARLQFGPVKAFVDGVVEAHTAAMLAPYADDPALGSGVPNWEPAQLSAAAVAAARAGAQVWLHAIGDGGVRMALDAHEAARRAKPGADLRGRIEHIETIDAADYPRFQALGVIASMQPLHANPDQNNEAVWVRNIGKERASRGFSWNNVQRAGGRLVFGSDWPVVTSDVMRGLYVATTRKTREGTPAGGWLPDLAVSLEDALRHYTIDGAYASFEEREKGSLEVGKLADFVVLSADLFEVAPEGILDVRPVLTVLGGAVVYTGRFP
jgi:predicted amidohydrolase YtcJ